MKCHASPATTGSSVLQHEALQIQQAKPSRLALKRKTALAVQSLFCLMVESLKRSDVAQHLPSAVQLDLVAHFFTRTTEGLGLQGCREYHRRRRRDRPWHATRAAGPVT